MFLSEWREFPSAPCLEGGKKTRWQLASRCCWNHARPWHASELVFFLVELKTYQHHGNIPLWWTCNWRCTLCTFRSVLPRKPEWAVHVELMGKQEFRTVSLRQTEIGDFLIFLGNWGTRKWKMMLNQGTEWGVILWTCFRLYHNW